MKLKELMVRGFRGYSKITLEFNGLVTHLIGVNGSGKSVILSAIGYPFKGPTTFDSKYRTKMITSDEEKKKFLIELEFIEEEIGRKMLVSASLTDKGTELLKIECSDDKEVSKKELFAMIKPICLKPFDIAYATPIEQARMMGVDTSECDRVIAEEKQNQVPLRAEVNRLKKVIENYGEPPEKIEPVSIEKLMDGLKEIENFNDRQSELVRAILPDGIYKMVSDIIHTKKGFTEIKNEIILRLNKLEIPQNLKSSDEIRKQISETEEINNKYSKYTQYFHDTQNLENAKIEYDKQAEVIKQKQQDKIDYIKNCKLPFKNVSFDDEGGLLISAHGQENAYLNEDFFSKGQIFKMAILIAISLNPEIKLILIDEARELDDKTIDFVYKLAHESGYQFILAHTGNEPLPDKHCIILEEQKIKQVTK